MLVSIYHIYIYVIKNYIIYTYMELQTNLYLEGPTVCNVNPAFKKKLGCLLELGVCPNWHYVRWLYFGTIIPNGWKSNNGKLKPPTSSVVRMQMRRKGSTWLTAGYSRLRDTRCIGNGSCSSINTSTESTRSFKDNQELRPCNLYGFARNALQSDAVMPQIIF